MSKIEVQSLPLVDVIRDFAEAFKTTYTENCGEYHLDLPSHIGQGYIKGINFDGGFGLIMYKCTFIEDMEVKFVVDEIHPLKFLYCLKGELEHRFQNGQASNTIEQYQSSIVASKNTNGHILHFKANIETQIGSLEINREKFQRKLDCELKSLSDELKSLFRDFEASAEFYHDGYFSLEIADLFRDTEKFEVNDFIRRIYLEGQAYKILTHQIIQYHDDLNDDSNRSLLRQSEIALVDKATAIIETELGSLETVDALAERVGLNVNKLQQGFKYMYGSTVNEYIQKQRLELAKRLLLNTELNISEIADMLGLSSKSYFSKIFKQAFALTPSEFKKKNRN
jgi:AraC-like DNA-binding protein